MAINIGDRSTAQFVICGRVASRLTLGLALIAGVASGCAAQIDSQETDKAIASVKSGDFSLSAVDKIVQAGAVQALPALREQFARVQDPLTKCKLASALLKLGDHDEAYWQYLVQQALPVIESDAPNPLAFDAQGKSIPGPSREFVKWAKFHHVSPDDAGGDAIYIDPGKVMLLATSGDVRAIPLLRRALESPNYFVKVFAAKGLAELQDKASIPFIINACKRAPTEMATLLAEQLVYFDDIQAQGAVDTFVPEDTARMDREDRARGRGPLGWKQ